MLALLYSFLCFMYWALLGRAVIALAYPRFGVLRSWLVAPGLGLSVLLLGVMVLNQSGIPIATLATPLTVALGIASTAVIAWRRPTTAWQKTAPYFLAVVFGLVWAGWPALETGFNWISYANDDMANYCLAAQRFMDHGFYAVPTMAELAGRDYSSYYFFMHVADMMRFGAEHLVAWGASLARVKATQAFMPMILSLSLVQICGAGALVLQLGRHRRRALLTVWLLAASPLFMLGTLYQLIAQVGGVALLLVVIALLLRIFITPRRAVLVRYAILPAIVASGLCIFYPEVTPFAGLVFVAYALIWAVREKTFPSGLIAIAAYTLVGVVILLRYNLISYVSILVVQFNGAMDASNLLLSLFPYFMLPTGFSNFFGWMPIAHDFGEPVISGSIAIGMILTGVILIRSLRESWRLTPAALLLLIQFTFALRLFAGANDFGLYKLAMWMQPVLAAGVAGVVLWATSRRRVWAFAAVAVYAATAAPTALYYANASRGLEAGGLTELRLASRLGLKVNPPTDKNAQLTSTIENVVAAKFAATELRGYPLALVSRDFFWPTTRTDFVHPTWPVRLHPHYAEMAQARPLIDERNTTLVTTGSLWRTTFTQPVIGRPTDYYVSLDPPLSLFNKFAPNPSVENDRVFVIEPAAQVHNRLLFVHSYLGNHYYLGDRRRISFFQQEQDLFAPGHVFNGIGRFMLLRIENPSPKVYLRISATRTLVTGRTAWRPMPVDSHGQPLPPIDASGNPTCPVVRAKTDVPIGAVGNGAFNLFVGPVVPEEFEGAHYLAIDFDEFPRQLRDYRSGLKRLYNQKVPLDYRRLLGWARDISAISVTQYAALHRPRSVSRFPEDLALAHDLEFSGAYEDGWLSPHSKFVLAGTRPGDLIRLRGAVPLLPGSSLGTGSVRVTVNGTKIGDLDAPNGTFDWLIPVAAAPDKTAIDLQFTAEATLAARDQRLVSAQLEYLGLVDRMSEIDCDYSRRSPRLAAGGVDQDGWMKRSANLLIPPTDQPVEVTLRIEYPDWSGAAPGMLKARIDGTESQLALVPGTRPTMRLRLPASTEIRHLELNAPDEFSLPAPDGRRRALRLLDVRIERAPTT